jgi:antitoxin HicB
MIKTEYLNLNYPIELIRDEEGGYFANHPDLPGCGAQGRTAEEAIANLDDARKLWIETRLEDNLPIPLPLSDEPSGKILLRMPPPLHAELAKQALRQNVSLNLLLNMILADYAGSSGYRAELDAFRKSVETLKELVIRAQQPEQPPVIQPFDLFVTDDPRSERSYCVSTFSQGLPVQLKTFWPDTSPETVAWTMMLPLGEPEQ